MNRDAFFARVRKAVRAGNTAGPPPLPARPPALGYQGAGPDPVERLRHELTTAGGVLHVTDDAAATVLGLVQSLKARSVLMTLRHPKLHLELLDAGLDVYGPDDTRAYFDADVGLTGVDALVVETGTIVLHTRPDQPRAASLLPPVHIAVAYRTQLVADLFDVFAGGDPPACLTLITGPSKTGDIELKLVTGVHGPGEVHVVLASA